MKPSLHLLGPPVQLKTQASCSVPQLSQGAVMDCTVWHDCGCSRGSGERHDLWPKAGGLLCMHRTDELGNANGR